MTPYEEVYELINKMKETKETLNGTDLEYFSKKQLQTLNQLSNELAAISFQLFSSIEEEE